MEPLSSHAKILTVEQSGLWIDALVPGQDGLWPSDVISFQFGEVGALQSFGPQHCLLKLKSGPEIILDLALPELRLKIQDCAGAVLDLKPFVNLSPKAEVVKSIRAAFAEAADAEKWAYIESLTITAHVRQSQGKEFKPYTFSGKDVQARKIEEGGSIFGDRNIRITMRPGKSNPFGKSEFIIESTLESFQQLCRAAYETGTGVLDISAYSLRKGLVPVEEKAASQPPLRP